MTVHCMAQDVFCSTRVVVTILVLFVFLCSCIVQSVFLHCSLETQSVWQYCRSQQLQH